MTKGSGLMKFAKSFSVMGGNHKHSSWFIELFLGRSTKSFETN